jgi:hypothetical protein
VKAFHFCVIPALTSTLLFLRKWNYKFDDDDDDTDHMLLSLVASYLSILESENSSEKEAIWSFIIER